MKLCRCPVCHSDINLDQLCEDDAGREILSLICDLKYGVARPLVAYIGLFRPAKSALSNSRALKLMREVLDQFPPSSLLAHCLAETVNSVQKNRREIGKIAPLSNHSYLKKVMDTNRPQFIGTAGAENAERQAEKSTAPRENSDENAIMYIDRFYRMGQPVEHLPGYEIWKKWKEKTEK